MPRYADWPDRVPFVVHPSTPEHRGCHSFVKRDGRCVVIDTAGGLASGYSRVVGHEYKFSPKDIVYPVGHVFSAEPPHASA
jgi:hypothetical protein